MTIGTKDDAETRAEARAWFLRLLLDDDAQDIGEWEDWLAGDPARQAAYDRVVLAWEVSRHADTAPAELPSIANDASEAVPPAWHRRHPKQALAMAASLAAVIGAGAVTYQLGLTPPPTVPVIATAHDFATKKGQHQMARLGDGSQIALGSATRVAVDLTPTRRNVSLKSGQIFVTVAKDRNRAFVVETPFSSVTAVGTAFDVDLLDAGFTLSVLHGTVLVRALGAKGGAVPRSMLVRAGQRVAVTRDGFSQLAWVAMSGAGPAWMTGRLEYRDVPLRSVVQDVNRYMTDGVVLIEPAAGNLRYTGSVDVTQIRQWLAGVVQAFDLSTTRDAGIIRIQKKIAA